MLDGRAGAAAVGWREGAAGDRFAHMRRAGGTGSDGLSEDRFVGWWAGAGGQTGGPAGGQAGWRAAVEADWPHVRATMWLSFLAAGRVCWCAIPNRRLPAATCRKSATRCRTW